MLDTTTTQTTSVCPPRADWHTQLRCGDVVSFRFPLAEDCDTAPKARPCLVLDIVSVAGERFAVLAYGTSAETPANRGYEVRIAHPARARSAGLHQPTRFVGARRLTVSLKHPAFAVADRGTPVLGSLSGEEEKRMHAVRARLHAEADMAAERRDERRRDRRRRRPEPVIVRRTRKRYTLPAAPVGPSA